MDGGIRVIDYSNTIIQDKIIIFLYESVRLV